MGGVESTVTPGDVTSLHCPVKSVAIQSVSIILHSRLQDKVYNVVLYL